MQAVRGQKSATVRIEGPFEFVDDGITTLLVPDGPHPEDLGPALKLRMKVIEVAEISDDGSLLMQFSNHLSIRVPSLPSYEAWEVLTGDRYIICLPGGKITVFRGPSANETE